MKARFYDARLTRFLTRDPIGLAGGTNPYLYANANPLFFIDPFGLEARQGRGFSGFLDGVQLGLDAAGMAPGLGAFPDGVNAGISLARGNFLDAGLSGIAAIPLVGDVVGGAKIGRKAIKFAEDAARSADTIAEGMRISPYRVTGPGETFIRYESGNPVFSKITPSGGVKPGTFAAPVSDGIVPLAERVSTYNLPSPGISRPNATTLQPPAGTPIIGPRPVSGGTGNEVIFWMGY
jgi:hypothetical protein